MKLLFAPDSFKGTLTSLEIIQKLTESAGRIFPEAELVSVPMADGGEGTIDALLSSLGGETEELSVLGPLGEPENARIGYLGDRTTAVLEMAQATALAMVSGRKNPFAADSFGTGQMIARVLDRGIRNIIIGIGGSATNDGGMGAMRALGVVFRDGEGRSLCGGGADLARVAEVDLSGLREELAQTRVTVICDVTNPLLGANGATYIYGPQKGVKEDELELLDKGMEKYITAVEEALDKEIRDMPGAGAAGGMGAALLGFLGAKLKPGIEVVLDTVGFDDLLCGASLVVTGEGRIDRQSVEFGKVPAGILKRCEARGVPVVVLSGGMGAGAEIVYQRYNASIMTTVNGVMPLSEALKDAGPLLEGAVERMFAFLRIGMEMGRIPA